MIINCLEKIEEWNKDLRQEIKKIDKKLKLAIITDYSDDSSKVYIKQKIKKCADFGIDCQIYEINKNTFPDINLVKKFIRSLNYNNEITGIMIQLPFTAFDSNELIQEISPLKDVDGLTTLNIGRLHNLSIPLDKTLVPCTPLGVLKFLLEEEKELSGKRVLILGRSQIVGRPLAELLLRYNCMVTVAHSKAAPSDYKDYDIIISAIGKPKEIIVDNKDAILIDVGINRDEKGKLCGDFNLDLSNFKKATPVPKGVGPMTVTMLMYNILKAYNIQK